MVERRIAGRYILHDELGAGGMGTVYRGLDSLTGQSVAIKQLKSQITQPDNIERFKREGDALRELNHPNIVKMLDTVEESGSHFLIMEYVMGGDLAALLKQRALRLEQILKFAIDLADALTRAHKLNIIHRDLKPANVLIGSDGVLRLTDFGVAHLGGKARITDTDAIVGTIDYLPPEAFRGETIDARGDIWAFGVMLYEMLTGRTPFRASSVAQIVHAILTEPIPDLEAQRPDAPIALVDLVYRMLNRNPQARIPSIRIIGAELEAIQQNRTLSSFQPQNRSFDTLPPLNPPKHNLPLQTTLFVGREHEMRQIAQYFVHPDLRLLTIVGQGGIGKTRLMLEVAHRLMGINNLLDAPPDGYADGVYFVELAPLTLSDNIITAIAQAVGCQFQSDGRSPRQHLLDFLRLKQIGLLIDNFEHLLDGAEIVTEIMRTAPHVRITVTSRERLNISGETVFHLEGMDFPDWETPDQALEYSAVQLFVQGATRVNPAFELKDNDLAYVARICKLAQGLPLAILLAASWLELLTVREIADEMRKTIDFLESDARSIPERQRSMRAVFDYSWNLMSTSEQQVFMRLSVFRGGFTRESAEAVAGATLRVLMALVNKSLIRRAVDSGRYEVHELTRQYAEIQLEAAGKADTAKQALAHYFVDFMVKRYPDIKGRRQLEALNEIDADFENVRAVWQWAYQHNEREIINQMLDGLYWYEDMRGQYHEAVENLLAAETALKHEPDAAYHRVRIRRIRHIVIPSLKEYSFEDAQIDDSLKAAQSRHDTREAAFCLFLLGSIAYFRGLYEDSLSHSEKSYRLYKEINDPYYISETLIYLAVATNAQGKREEGLSFLKQALEIKQQIHDVAGVAWASYFYTWFMAARHDYAEAETSIKRGLENMRLLRSPEGMIYMADAMIWMLFFKGEIAEARATAIATLHLAIDKNHRLGIAQSSANFALMAFLINEVSDDTRKAIENLKTDDAQKFVMHTLPGHYELCFTLDALNKHDYETARAQFKECLRHYSPRPKLVLPLVVVFVVKATLDFHQDKYESAARWLAIASHYPYQNLTWLNDWTLATRLYTDLKAQLGNTVFEAAWGHGKLRNIETVVQDLQAEYGDTTG